MARRGSVQIRPLGGAAGCLAMIAFSIVASLLLTLIVNFLIQ